METKKTIFLLCLVILISGLLFIGLLTMIMKKNSQCIENPLSYAAETFYKSTSKTDYLGETEKTELEQEDVLFSCTVDDLHIYFDSKGIYTSHPRSNIHESNLRVDPDFVWANRINTTS